MELPDFLHLTDERIGAEARRQARLRVDFHSRVRMPAAQQEYVRGREIEPTLRAEAANLTGAARDEVRNRLAEAVAAQGRFGEAASLTTDDAARSFFTAAWTAVHDPQGCSCESPTLATGPRTRIRPPKFRVLKEIHNLRQGVFGYLAECNACGGWSFLGGDPTPSSPEPKPDFEILRA